MSIIERAAGKLEKERSRSPNQISPREPVNSGEKLVDEREIQAAGQFSRAVVHLRFKSL